MNSKNIVENVNNIIDEIGMKNSVVSNWIEIGTNQVKAAVIFINGIANQELIDRDIVSSFRKSTNKGLEIDENTLVYLKENYINMANNYIEKDENKAIDALKRGKTIFLLDGVYECIIFDTTMYPQRTTQEPENERVIRGSREGFVESIDTNIAIIRKKVKDKNLTLEYLKVGKKSQTDLVLIYLKDVADENVIKKLKDKINKIDVDFVVATGNIEQYIDNYSYNIFPQFGGTERPDKVEANIMEGRVALILDGTPYVLTIPSVFFEFFQAPDDYYERSIISSFVRILRYLAAVIVITLEPFYLTLINSNNEFIPVKFVIPIAQARQGIALSILVEILAMNLVVELLREGGLRLPTKIASTLSLVGGIIVGNTAIESKLVSPTTLFIVGFSTIATFVITNYDMSLAVRFVKFIMIILAYFLGIFGISLGWYLILLYLCSLENFDTPYFGIKKEDLKDIIIRGHLSKMNKTPESIPTKNK
ncbi:MAG: spore germination protein [Clostridiaceae bacterium]